MRLLFACLAASIAAASISSARADTPAPVAVNSCNLIYDKSNVAGTITGLDVQFTNNAATPASVVNIKTNINGATQIVRDQGSFAPGIEIHHRYKAGGQQFALPAVVQSIFGAKPAVTCTIDSVQFADGTRWPGSAAAASSSAISVTNQSLAFDGTGNAGARLILASGGGPLSMNSNCGNVANVELVSSTSRDIALKVTPKGAGSCAITIRDGNGNVTTVPVTVP